jgi:hypothetical protein
MTNFNDDDFMGNLSPTLRTMSDVCAAHLERGHSFPDRDLVLLCISKEANFCGIYYTVKKSDDCQLYCTGPGFLIYASHLVMKGWLVTRCEICDTESAGDTQPNTHQHGFCSPFRTNMIVPLIATTIAESPMVLNKVLRNILEPYRKAYCFTDNILQNSRTKAHKLISGVPEENVGYASFLKDELEKLGHFVLLSFTNQKETIKNLEKIIIADEVLRQKDAHLEDLAPNNRRAFVSKWMNDNSEILLKQLGWNYDNVSFLDGVLFVPLFVQKTVPHLQQTYMADACHFNFGKYTLFSCYSATANSNMSPVGFAIIIGNKNTSNWTKFWEYVLKLHPSMNSGYITIITNQDKGKKNAIVRQLQRVGHFHCSWHCHQNIIQRCEGGSGKTQYSALWMYNKLMRCRNPAKIKYTRTMFVKHMSAKDL